MRQSGSFWGSRSRGHKTSDGWASTPPSLGTVWIESETRRSASLPLRLGLENNPPIDKKRLFVNLLGRPAFSVFPTVAVHAPRRSPNNPCTKTMLQASQYHFFLNINTKSNLVKVAILHESRCVLPRAMKLLKADSPAHFDQIIGSPRVPRTQICCGSCRSNSNRAANLFRRLCSSD
jgi:hypothetical protein